MVARAILGCFLLVGTAFGQLPDREKLIEQFVQPSQMHYAAQELMKHFQLGGVRSIIRNMNRLPQPERMSIIWALKDLDLMRFRNDIYENLQEAPDNLSKAGYLMLLGTIGDQIESSVFEPFATNESLPMYVRLAALGGLCQVQNIANYDRFHSAAEKADYEPAEGKNDFLFANADKNNRGFFGYTNGKIMGDEIPRGIYNTALAMACDESESLYQYVLDKRKRRDMPTLIDRAVETGAMNMLDLMASDRAAKKFRDEIAAAKAAVEALSPYRAKIAPRDQSEFPIAAFLPWAHLTADPKRDFRAAFAIIKVDQEGQISVEAYETPFGAGNDNIKAAYQGKVLAAQSKWSPIESYYLVVAPN